MTIDEVRDLIKLNSWRFAKTMPQNPHEYTLRKNWQSEEKFVEFVQFIRDHGTPRRWGKATYIYLDLDGWQYWSMGAPLPITILVNRAKLPS